MKSLLVASTLVAISTISTAHAGFLSNKFKKESPICRDAVITLLGESAANTNIHFVKTLTGVDADGKVCEYEITVNESTSNKTGTIGVTGEGFWPFTNSIEITNNAKNCKADNQKVNGYGYDKRTDGINRHYPRDLTIEKVAANGKIKLTYKQTGPTKECTGELK